MAGYCTHCGASGFRRPSQEPKPVQQHKSTLCQAVVGVARRHHIPFVQQCQQTGTHHVDEIKLCGIHFNAAFRKPLEIVGKLRQLGDNDVIGATDELPNT